jgi:hypothetical protein
MACRAETERTTYHVCSVCCAMQIFKSHDLSDAAHWCFRRCAIRSARKVIHMRLPCGVINQIGFARGTDSGTVRDVMQPETTLALPLYIEPEQYSGLPSCTTGCWLLLWSLIARKSASTSPFLALRRHIWTTCDNARACRQAMHVRTCLCVVMLLHAPQQTHPNMPSLAASCSYSRAVQQQDC